MKTISVSSFQGASLSGAMDKHPKAFGDLYVAMVKAGETGGVLDNVLLRLADNIEKEVELRRKVKSAMTYPVVVVLLVNVPAKVVLGVWFVLQFFTNPNEGVAWVAHVGGFAFGVLVGLLLRGFGDRTPPAPVPYPDPWSGDYRRFGGRY